MQHRESAGSLRSEHISLYAAGFGAAAVGVLVMGRAVSDAMFSVFALTLMAAGFITSSMVRSGRLARSISEGILLSVLAIGTALVFVNPAFRYIVLPIQTLASSDLVLATVLVWLMVVYSFNLRTDRAVLFMCVPPLSLIGLMSTFDPGSQPLVYFILYLCFACFALVQQNALSHAAPEEHRQLRGNLKVAIVITLQALAIGAVFGWVLEAALDKTAGPSLLARNVAPSQESYLDSDFMQVATGPTAVSEQEVMTVSCSEPLLWRSQVYDKYTGRGWMNTMSVREEQQPILVTSAGRPDEHLGAARFESFPSSFSIPQEPECANRQHVKRVEQVFRLTGGRIASVYAAAEPVLVGFRGPQMLMNANGRINLRLPYGRDAAYVVSSLVTAATPDELRRASTYYPPEIEERYLQVPDSCRQIEPALNELVRTLPTAYDKVIAIRNYLEVTYVYDLAAPAAPADEDAVVHFMLRSRRGYCDVFASSMAVMCRLSGIPARVVVGYATGAPEPGRHVYHVRQKDRHAWVEVLFPGYGWVPFDPAPQAARSTLSTRLRALWSGIWGAVTSQTSTFWTYALLLCLVIYLLKVEGLDRLLRRRRRLVRSLASVGRAAENYRRMCDVFGRLGYPRPPSMTPREYCLGLESVLMPNCANLVPGVQAVTIDFIEARYAGRELSRDRMEATSSLLTDLIREARQAAKQSLFLKSGELSG